MKTTAEKLMSTDPWGRPSSDDLRRIQETFDRDVGPNVRAAERLDLAVPAEIRTQRGNTIEAITREISRTGIGLLHRGAINMEEVYVKMASETREFYYRVQIEWCMPCDNGMFLSGGRFLPVQDQKF
jgi:hypothetical protein